MKNKTLFDFDHGFEWQCLFTFPFKKYEPYNWLGTLFSNGNEIRSHVRFEELFDHDPVLGQTLLIEPDVMNSFLKQSTAYCTAYAKSRYEGVYQLDIRFNKEGIWSLVIKANDNRYD